MIKNNLKKLILLALSMTILLGGLVGCKKKNENEDIVEENYTPVEVQEINKSTLENARTFNGKVVANEEVMVIPKMVGIVESVNVKLGDYVSEGQTLFVIEQDDMQNNVEQSKVAINLAEKGVQQAQNAIETAKINRITAEKNAAQSKIDLDRMRTLFEEGAIPKSQLEQAELGNVSSDSQLKTLESQIAQAEIAYNQATDQLNQAQLAHKQLLDNFENTVVKAPISGIVSSLDVKRGQIVNNAQPAAVVVDTKKVYVEVEVIEDVVNNLKVGQNVSLTIDAAFDKPINSKIDYISSTADIASKLYSVKAYIENTDNLAKPGMSADLTLNIDELEDSISIPRDAILNSDDESFIFVVENDTAIKRIIETGADFGDFIEIKSGVNLGDKLIIKGHHYVDDETKVKIVGGES